MKSVSADPAIGVVWQHVGRRFAARRLYRRRAVSGLSVVLEPSLRGLTLPGVRDPGYGIYDLPALENLPKLYLVCGAGAVCDLMTAARVPLAARPYWEKFVARDLLGRTCLTVRAMSKDTAKPVKSVFLEPGWDGSVLGQYGV